MRMARIKPRGVTCYHVCSRIVNKDYRLTAEEKRAFLGLMRRAEAFSGVTVLDYCLMDNHFHLLVEVPCKEPIPDAELFRRIQALYGDKFVTDLKKKWDMPTYSNARDRAMFTQRMDDISEFMKTLKQRYSMHYNRVKRQGTLWEGRFHSTVVERNATTDILPFVAGYIDTNPVRAKLVEDPAAYPWSGFGAACSGDATAQAGICSVYSPTPDSLMDWATVRTVHSGNLERWTVERECRQGRLSLSRRIPHIMRGTVIGSPKFVASMSKANKRTHSVPESTDICTAHAVRVA